MARRPRADPSSPLTPSPPLPTRHHWLAIAGIVLAGALAYANSLSGPFVLDDQASIVNNSHLRHLWPPLRPFGADQDSSLAGRPIATLSLAINFAVGGLDVRGYHLANIVLHLCAGLLLFGIVRRTLDLPAMRGRAHGSPASIACATALLWVLHPLNTDAVNYLTQRTELLMALCYGLTLYCSLRAHQSLRPRVWLGLGVASCAVGMGCKESMVTCPVLVVLFDRAFAYGSYREMFRARGRWYLALGATWAVLVLLNWSGPRTHSAGFSSGVSPWTYLLNQCVMITHYLRLAIWPTDLVFIYGTPRPLALGDVLLPAAFIVSLAALAIWAWYRRPAVGFLGLWLFITLSPTSSVVPIATEVGAERRMYLPLAGLMVLAVIGARWLVARTVTRVPIRWRTALVWRVAGWVAVAAAALALTKGTIDRNREYQSALGLAQTALARWPTGQAHHTVAIELLLGGRTDEAWPHLQAAIRDTPVARYTLGVALMGRGRWTEAIEQLNAFVRAEPWREQAVAARSLMGQAWLQQGQPDAAVEQFRLALQMNPSGLDARAGLADALSQQGRFDEAIGHYRTYVAERPDNAQATRNLAMLLFNRGEYTEAATHARRAVDARPADAVSHDLLGVALAELSQWDDAIAELREARRLDPTNTDVQEHLERVLQSRAASRPAP
jgi:tetratricopeptide (TPR) repeat protein